MHEKTPGSERASGVNCRRPRVRNASGPVRSLPRELASWNLGGELPQAPSEERTSGVDWQIGKLVLLSISRRIKSA
jgi:hypothetical protein